VPQAPFSDEAKIKSNNANGAHSDEKWLVVGGPNV
jgi:hypothetical protein